MSNREYLHNLALKAPSESGVYLWKDREGNIIYVGKAKSLKNRLSSYFSKTADVKTQLLVSHAHDIEYIKTINEYEALLLENTLIKKHKPKYNINLKDGKTYPVIKITNEPFPTIFRTRTIRSDGALYFGPFPNVFAVDTFLHLIKQNYKLRQCKVLRKKTSPCLYYHIGRCSAPCCKKISQEEYAKEVDEVKQLLTSIRSIDVLQKEMHEAAQMLDFEKAKRLRDGIQALNALHNQNVVEDLDEQSRDYIAWASEGTLLSFAVLKMRSGKLIAREIYRTQSLKDDEEILQEFLPLFYTNATDVPYTIFVPIAGEYSVLKTWFTDELKVNTQIMSLPLRNTVDMTEKYSTKHDSADYVAESSDSEMYTLTINQECTQAEKTNAYLNHHLAALQMAFLNAREDIVRRSRETGDWLGLEELKKVLNLQVIPSRIEGFDIAHLEGHFTVASLISFKDGNPDKKNYRLFRLRTTDGINNDYASMKEVVARRYVRLLNEHGELPDLILIDGGLGQVNTAHAVLQALHIEIPVIGLAEKNEEIFFPHSSKPLKLPKKSDALRLLQRVRDETHRFANSRNNRLREKAMIKLQFEKLDGVGVKRAKILLKNFGSLTALASAQPTEVSKLLGITEDAAKKIIIAATHKC